MDNPETLATLGTQDTEQIHVRDNQRAIKNGQSRDTGNIGYIRHRKIHVRDNQRTIKKGQSRDTGNIGYTRHRTNTR